MAGDVVIHRAYFGAGDIEDLQQRVAYLFNKSQQGVIDAEIVDGPPSAEALGRYHESILDAMADWLQLQPLDGLVSKSKVMDKLRDLSPDPFN